MWARIAGGIAAWAALAIATAALASAPVAVLLPLIVLAAIFEAVYALHVGVERIGRYIHVFHEHGAGDAGRTGGAGWAGWEHLASAFGKPAGAATSDPLFCAMFFLAALANALPALMLNPLREELIFVGGAHVLFVIRLLAARHAARNQRAIDQARFEQLR